MSAIISDLVESMASLRPLRYPAAARCKDAPLDTPPRRLRIEMVGWAVRCAFLCATAPQHRTGNSWRERERHSIVVLNTCTRTDERPRIECDRIIATSTCSSADVAIARYRLYKDILFIGDHFFTEQQ